MYATALAFLMIFTPDARMYQGIALSRAGDYEQSEKLLATVQPASVSNINTYYFHRLFNNFRMNKKKEAERHLAALENSFDPNIPERYKVVAQLMKNDLSVWKDDDLGDIARDMSHVQDRLKNAQGGKQTQKIQSDVVARLDKLIKQMEDKAKGGGGGDAKDPQDGSEQAKEKGKGAGQKAAQPLDESQIADAAGTGKVDVTRMKRLGDQWGRLPPRERARALQELTAGMSPRHREAIDNYFRNLATPPQSSGARR